VKRVDVKCGVQVQRFLYLLLTNVIEFGRVWPCRWQARVAERPAKHPG